MRVLVNPRDAVSLRRILNEPKRGIGDRAEAVDPARSPTAARHQLLGGADPRRRGDRPRHPLARTRSRRSRPTMTELMAMADTGAPADAVLEAALTRSPATSTTLEQSTDPQDETRVENLAELVAVAREFVVRAGTLADDAGRGRRSVEGDDVLPPGSVAAFLEQVALVADADSDPRRGRRRRHPDDAAHRQGSGVPRRVPHRPRGRRLPAHAVDGDPKELEEERRLAYVGITRAEQRLYVTRALVRSGLGCAVVQPGVAVPRRDPCRPRRLEAPSPTRPRSRAATFPVERRRRSGRPRRHVPARRSATSRALLPATVSRTTASASARSWRSREQATVRGLGRLRLRGRQAPAAALRPRREALTPGVPSPLADS